MQVERPTDVETSTPPPPPVPGERVELRTPTSPLVSRQTRDAEVELIERRDPTPTAQRRLTLMDRLDGFLFVFAGVAALWLGWLLLQEGVRFGWQALLLIVFWLVFTYLLLPRIHRILTRLYVPDYFIGRTRTADGLLGDPVNLSLLGHEAQIHAAMTAAGWTLADDLTPRTARRIATSTLSRRSYPHAPVSALLLFDRQQDFAYQQEVAGSPSKRHHVRFWRAPQGWLLPGGFRVDWIAAGTFDRSVGFSLFTFQVTHKIERDTDIERDFIISTLVDAEPRVQVRVIENFSTGYHSRNGGGDLIETDGDLPIIDLTAVPAPELPPVALTDSRDKRPAQTSFAAGVALTRAGLYLLIALAVSFLPVEELKLEDFDGLAAEDVQPVRIIVAVLIVLLAALDVWLGLATLAGRNWARVLLMLFSVFVTVSAYLNSYSPEGWALSTDPTVGLSILVLLALTSPPARAWALRSRHRAKRVSERSGPRRRRARRSEPPRRSVGPA